MVEMFNSSFIPKKEFEVKKKKKKSGFRINIVFLISLIIFLSMIVGLIWVNFYKNDLEKVIKAKKEHFTKNAGSYAIETIKDYVDLDKRIKIGEKLLQQHYNLEPIFTYLELKTLKKVFFKSLEIREEEQYIVVHANVAAPNEDTVYLQSQSYAENPNAKDLLISNLADSKEGFLFDLDFKVDKKDLTIRNFNRN